MSPVSFSARIQQQLPAARIALADGIDNRGRDDFFDEVLGIEPRGIIDGLTNQQAGELAAWIGAVYEFGVAVGALLNGALPVPTNGGAR